MVTSPKEAPFYPTTSTRNFQQALLVIKNHSYTHLKCCSSYKLAAGGVCLRWSLLTVTLAMCNNLKIFIQYENALKASTLYT